MKFANFNAFTRDAGMTFIIRILGAISALSLNILVARSISLSDAGLFFLLLAIVTVLGTIGSAGLNTSLIRFISPNYEKNNWIEINSMLFQGIRRSASLSFTLLFAALVINYFYGKTDSFNDNSIYESAMLMLLCIPAFSLNLCISASFQGIFKPLTAVLLLSILAPLLFNLIFGLIIIFFDVNLLNASLAYFLASWISLFFGIGLWMLNKKNPNEFVHKKSNELIKSSNYLFTSTLMILFVQWTGQIVSSFYVDSENIALLAASQRVSLLISFILIVVNYVAAPKYAAAFEKNNFEELKSISHLASRIMIAIAAPISFAVILFPKYILLIFGSEYTDGWLLLVILSVGQIINVLTGSVAYLLNMTNNEKVMRNIHIFTGIICIFMNFVLIPVHGVLGAAISTSACLALQNLLAFYQVKKKLGFSTIRIW